MPLAVAFERGDAEKAVSCNASGLAKGIEELTPKLRLGSRGTVEELEAVHILRIKRPAGAVDLHVVGYIGERQAFAGLRHRRVVDADDTSKAAFGVSA